MSRTGIIYIQFVTQCTPYVMQSLVRIGSAKADTAEIRCQACKLGRNGTRHDAYSLRPLNLNDGFLSVEYNNYVQAVRVSIVISVARTANRRMRSRRFLPMGWAGTNGEWYIVRLFSCSLIVMPVVRSGLSFWRRVRLQLTLVRNTSSRHRGLRAHVTEEHELTTPTDKSSRHLETRDKVTD